MGLIWLKVMGRLKNVGAFIIILALNNRHMVRFSSNVVKCATCFYADYGIDIPSTEWTRLGLSLNYQKITLTQSLIHVLQNWWLQQSTFAFINKNIYTDFSFHTYTTKIILIDLFFGVSFHKLKLTLYQSNTVRIKLTYFN